MRSFLRPQKGILGLEAELSATTAEQPAAFGRRTGSASTFPIPTVSVRRRYCGGNYKPAVPAVEEMEPGTFYLVEVGLSVI